MNRRIIRILLIVLAISIAGCKTIWTKNENPQSPDLGRYNHIFVGWIDFGKDNWQKYGYKSPDDWYQVIKQMNTEWLRGATKEALPGREMSYAQSETSVPEGVDLAIKFSNVTIEPNWNATGGNDNDYIKTDISFIDQKNGRTVYRVNLTASSRIFGPRAWGQYQFENRIGYAVEHVVGFIKNKFQH